MNIRTLSFVLLTAAFSHNPMAFCAQFTFTPRASVEEAYTDNVFLTNDDTEDDFITTVSAGFTAGLLGRTSGLDFSFDPNYEFYDRFNEFNEWGLLSDLRAWTTPSRATRFEVTNNFIRTTNPLGREDRITTVDGPPGRWGSAIPPTVAWSSGATIRWWSSR